MCCLPLLHVSTCDCKSLTCSNWRCCIQVAVPASLYSGCSSIQVWCKHIAGAASLYTWPAGTSLKCSFAVEVNISLSSHHCMLPAGCQRACCSSCSRVMRRRQQQPQQQQGRHSASKAWSKPATHLPAGSLWAVKSSTCLSLSVPCNWCTSSSPHRYEVLLGAAVQCNPCHTACRPMCGKGLLRKNLNLFLVCEPIWPYCPP